jgi:polyhydroxyalkanoate synthesis regulator phasin
MAKRRTTPQQLPDAVRDAVERTLQATLGGAQQTRGRAQEALDDVVSNAEAGAKNVRARVREAVDRTRPATSDDIKALRKEINALSRRLDKLEGKKKPAAKSSPKSRSTKRS